MRKPIFACCLSLAAACGSNPTNSTPDSNSEGQDAPDGTPTTITVTLRNRPDTPASFSFLVAYQDGTGAWQLAPAPTGDVYTFTVSSGIYGVGWTCVTGPATASVREVHRSYFAVAERASFTEA